MVKNVFGRGYYVPTRHEDILGVLQDPQTFSLESVVAYEPDPAYRWIPHMINGDEHRQWRRQLGPYFSPRATERSTPRSAPRPATSSGNSPGAAPATYVGFRAEVPRDRP